MIGAADVLRWFRRYGWTEDCEGEWGAIQQKERAGLRTMLTNGDEATITRLLDHWFQTPLYWGLVSLPGNTEAEFRQLLGYAIYWRIAQWVREVDVVDLERLRAPVACSPFCFTVDGVPVASDAPRFDAYADMILRQVGGRACVYEIGSGYGGVALQLVRRSSSLRIVLCDIPETLYLAAWWLARSVPDGVTVGWWDEAPEATIRLLPIAERDVMTCHPDMVFAAHTFSGLPRQVFDGWADHIATMGPRLIYHDDAVNVAPAGTWMTEKFPELMVNDMRFPGYREVWRRRIPWTGFGDRFTEVLWSLR